MCQRRRRFLATLAAAALMGAGTVAVAPTAQAATVTDAGLLVWSLGYEDQTVLGASIDAGRSAVVRGGNWALDLNGYDLRIERLGVLPGGSLEIDLNGGTLTLGSRGLYSTGLRVPEGASLTITDSDGSGVLNATSSLGAGIGGDGWDTAGVGGASGTITIEGGTVNASSESGAGIGGGHGPFAGGAGGTVTISGNATVTAESTFGAGIGGGGGGPGGPGSGGAIAINDAVVKAASVAGAGIGGGFGEDLGGTTHVNIGSGGVVTASSRHWTPVDLFQGGSLIIDDGGTLVLPHTDGVALTLGPLLVPEGATVTNAGIIRGDPVDGDGQIVRDPDGAGTAVIENSGTILLYATNVVPEEYGFVTGNNFLVDFRQPGPELLPLRVFAASFATGSQEFHPGVWTTEQGTVVDADTELGPLAVAAPDGEHVVTLYPAPDSITVAADPGLGAINQPVDVTVTGWLAGGDEWGVLTSGVQFDYGDGHLDTSASHTYTSGGTHTLTATWNGAQATTTVDVADTIQVTTDQPTGQIGQPVALSTTAWGGGDLLRDVTAEATITAPDGMVTDNEVTFASAGQHTVTATWRGLSADIVIDVAAPATPTPSPAPATPTPSPAPATPATPATPVTPVTPTAPTAPVVGTKVTGTKVSGATGSLPTTGTDSAAATLLSITLLIAGATTWAISRRRTLHRA